MVRSFKAFVLLIVIAAVPACSVTSGSSGARIVEQTFTSMGSELKLKAWTADEATAVAAFEEVANEFDRLEGLMSTWREHSEIQELNRAAGKHPVRVGTELRSLFTTANQVSQWTDGKFDVTFGVMSGLWKFDYQNKDDTIPDPAEVARRRKLINYRDLIVNESAGTAFLRRDGMIASLGGIGKGYAVDRAREILLKHGFHDFIIQFGGDMYVAGHEADRAWRVGIQDPRGPKNRIFASMELSDSTFSTSGDYERFFMHEGRRYHHIIDPAIGEPARASRSVTIVSARAILADALAKGVFILGGRKGMELIERVPGVEGVIVTDRNEVLVSPGLRSRLMMLATPTDAP